MEVLHELGAAREEWVGLGERSDNLFATWEWADTWWRHFGKGRELAVQVAYRGDRLVAALPLCTQRRKGLRVLTFLGAEQVQPGDLRRSNSAV